MAITLVGNVTNTFVNSGLSLSLTGLTGGSDSAPIAGDIVVIISGAPETADTNVSITTSGYTNQELYANDTRDANGVFAYKIMGGTPDTTVAIPATSASTVRGSVVARVYRGVDQTTPIDVAVTTATGANGDRANSPSITPVTAGAKILALGFATNPASTSGTATGPANMADFITVVGSGSGRSSIAGMASQDWTSGAFDPAAWTATTNNANDSWVAFTVALRPAATDITGTAADTLAFDGAATGTALNTGVGADSFAITGAATANVLAIGIASGDFSASGAATGATLVSGVASATFDISGSSSTSQDVAGTAAGDFGITGSADGTVQALVRIVRGDDGDDHRWQRIFYKDLDEALDEILEADDAQEVAQAVSIEFAPFVASLPDPTPIADALEQLRHVALKRRDVAKRVEIVRAEIERARLRKKRNNEAALMLLLQ